MEVVLLWLDDLDDALFSVALAWERLRRVVLKIGLASAVALAASELSAIATHWAPAFCVCRRVERRGLDRRRRPVGVLLSGVAPIPHGLKKTGQRLT